MAGKENRTREERKHQLEDVVNSQGLTPDIFTNMVDSETFYIYSCKLCPNLIRVSSWASWFK